MDPSQQQPSDDPEVLASQVKQARADLNKLTVQGENIIIEAKRKADVLEKRAAELEGTIIPGLLQQERTLTQKVANLTEAAKLKEQDMIDAQAALSQRESDLNVRERHIKAKEQQHSAVVRRQLTD